MYNQIRLFPGLVSKTRFELYFEENPLELPVLPVSDCFWFKNPTLKAEVFCPDISRPLCCAGPDGLLSPPVTTCGHQKPSRPKHYDHDKRFRKHSKHKDLYRITARTKAHLLILLCVGHKTKHTLGVHLSCNTTNRIVNTTLHHDCCRSIH